MDTLEPLVGGRAEPLAVVPTVEAAPIELDKTAPQEKPPLDIVECFTQVNIYHFYQYLRWSAFQDIDERRKAVLMKKLMVVPVRTLLPEIAALITANDAEGLETLATNSALDKDAVQREVRAALGIKVVFGKDTDEIVDLYVAEKDEKVSEYLLSYLLQYDVTGPDGPQEYARFIAKYKKVTDDETKLLLLSRHYEPEIFM